MQIQASFDVDNIFIFYCWNRRNTVQILFAKQLLPDFHNISGTHCDQQISRSAVVQKISLDLVKGREVFAWSTQLFNLRLKILGRNSKSIGFSCRINVSQNYMVSQVSALANSGRSAWYEYKCAAEKRTTASCGDNCVLRLRLPGSLWDDVHNHPQW